MIQRDKMRNNEFAVLMDEWKKCVFRMLLSTIFFRDQISGLRREKNFLPHSYGHRRSPNVAVKRWSGTATFDTKASALTTRFHILSSTFYPLAVFKDGRRGRRGKGAAAPPTPSASTFCYRGSTAREAVKIKLVQVSASLISACQRT
jgi:hypothetical protein